MMMICLTLLNPLLPKLNAKMSVISPKEMIRISDYIVVGIIKKRKFEGNHRQVVISVETVLKGKNTEKEIVLSRNNSPGNMDPFGYSFDFPEKGTKVMVLLRNYADIGLSLTYANSICVINKNKVYLYKGMGFGARYMDNEVNWAPKDYQETYQDFYQNAVSMRLN
jgi:hypothetical protein